MSQDDTKSIATTEDSIAALPRNPISEKGNAEVPKKPLGKLSCFARGSNIECLVSHDDIIPQKPARRARDLGREIVDRANRCTWYEDMVAGENDSLVKIDSKEIAGDEQSEAGDVSVKSSAVECCGDENENKMLIKRLEKQQIAILKQQEVLNKQLALEVSPVEIDVIDSKSELIDDADKGLWKGIGSRFDSRFPKRVGSHQRRLRGDLAKQCAARSEGSIKSLIWNEDDIIDNFNKTD